MSKRPFYKHNIFLALLACLLWSSAFPGIKIGLQYTSPLQFAGIRFMISGLIILPFCKNLRINLKVALLNVKSIFLISLFQTIILYTLFYLGISRTPAAIAAIIVGASPLIVAFLAHFMTGKDPLSIRKIIALLIGFAGIVILTLGRDNSTTDHSSTLPGIILLLIASVAGSFGNILVSKNTTGVPPLLVNSLQIFFGGLVIFLLSLFFEDFKFAIKPLPYYLSLGWLSFLSATAFSIWFIILSRPEVKVSDINVWKFSIPMLGAILSWLLIPDEKPMWHTISGMLFIAMAIVIIYFHGIKKLFSRNG